MSKIESSTRVTYEYLMRKSKADLAWWIIDSLYIQDHNLPIKVPAGLSMDEEMVQLAIQSSAYNICRSMYTELRSDIEADHPKGMRACDNGFSKIVWLVNNERNKSKQGV